MMAVFASILAALFSGLLALKAFGNRKPVAKSFVKTSGKQLLRIYNPNPETSVLIQAAVNQTSLEQLAIAKALKNGKILTFKKIHRQVGIRRRIDPREDVFFEFQLDDAPIDLLSFRSMVERDSFNFFDSFPSFNIVVRPNDYKSRLERFMVLTAPMWRKHIARYDLDDDLQPPQANPVYGGAEPEKPATLEGQNDPN